MNATISTPCPPAAETTVFRVIAAISVCHLINDMLQSLLPAIYPNLRTELGLSFSQIGLVTLTCQLTASVLQPLVGHYSDRRPTPLALPGGALISLAGLLVLAVAHSYALLLTGAALLGIGSSVFHPESSRVARMAAGRRHGMAQALFQVGGNAGAAVGPLAAAIVVARLGQISLGIFALLALVSCAVLLQVSDWYRHQGLARLAPAAHNGAYTPTLPRGKVIGGIAVLLTLSFSKYVYLASITSYFTFYLMERFGVSVEIAQIHLFVFLAAVAVGTIAGGPLGDRFGRKHVIWFSIFGAFPFTVLLPHASLFWTGPLTVVIGLILASAFPAMVVFAQELVPGKVGMISGLFFGFSFGMGGAGAAILGEVADRTGIGTVYTICSFLPALGLLAVALPNSRAR